MTIKSLIETFFKELPRVFQPRESNISDDEVEMLKTSLTELRRVYDLVCSHYEQLKLKALGVMGVEGAVLGFIFTNNQGISVPVANDRKIFFWGALVFLSLAFAILVWIISTVEWLMPHDLDTSNELIKRHRTNKNYVQFIHDDLIIAIKHDKEITRPKARKFNWAVYLIVAGVTILLVIKYGGTNNNNDIQQTWKQHSLVKAG